MHTRAQNGRGGRGSARLRGSYSASRARCSRGIRTVTTGTFGGVGNALHSPSIRIRLRGPSAASAARSARLDSSGEPRSAQWRRPDQGSFFGTRDMACGSLRFGATAAATPRTKTPNAVEMETCRIRVLESSNSSHLRHNTRSTSVECVVLEESARPRIRISEVLIWTVAAGFLAKGALAKENKHTRMLSRW